MAKQGYPDTDLMFCWPYAVPREQIPTFEPGIQAKWLFWFVLILCFQPLYSKDSVGFAKDDSINLWHFYVVMSNVNFVVPDTFNLISG